MDNFFIVLIVLILTKSFLHSIIVMCNKRKIYATNYMHNEIPCSIGIIFPLVLLPLEFLLWIFYKEKFWAIASLIGTLGIGFLGVIDDYLGDKEFQGFKGHLKALFKNKIMTTGMLKALMGGFIFLIVNFTLYENYLEIFLNTVLLALSTNTINLFDMRPGRSCKVFILMAIIVYYMVSDMYIKGLLLGTIAMIFVYAGGDLKGEYMMGDVGSNTLGFLLGMGCIGIAQNSIKWFFVLFFLVLNILSEKISFTKLIEKSIVLNKIDHWKRS